jgi:hypothetical protein
MLTNIIITKFADSMYLLCCFYRKIDTPKKVISFGFNSNTASDLIAESSLIVVYGSLVANRTPNSISKFEMTKSIRKVDYFGSEGAVVLIGSCSDEYLENYSELEQTRYTTELPMKKYTFY